MAGYPLQSLVRARRLREQAAARTAARARNQLAAAREAERQARETLRRHRDWRPHEEERLFQAIRGAVLSQADLTRHRQDLQALRQRELDLESALDAAAQAVAARRLEVEAARRRQAEVVRGRQKIETHRAKWRREQRQRLEAAEEAELEEFFVANGDREEGP